MAVRFFGDFKNDVGDTFRINIYDDTFSGTSAEVTVAVPGVVLSYEGDNESEFQPIIPSKCEFTFFNEGGDFDTWLNTTVPAAVESQLLVEVLTEPGGQGEAVFWRGVMFIDQLSMVDESTPSAVTFTAGDDINQLKETTVNDLSVGSGEIANYVRAALALTRTHGLWADSDQFLTYFNDFEPNGYSGSDYLGEGIMTLPSIPGSTPTEYYNAYDVLRSLAISFNARVFQAGGVWYFLPYNVLERVSEGTIIAGDMFAQTADGSAYTLTSQVKSDFQSGVTITNGTNIRKKAGNLIEYSAPIKRVLRQRITKASEFLFQFNTDFTSLDSTSPEIDLADDDRTYFAGSTHLITLNYNIEINAVASDNNYINNHTVRADYTIKFGSQYFTDTGWTSTPGTKKVVLGSYFKSAGFENIGQISVQVPELVSDQVGLDVTLNVVVLNGAGGDIVASLPTNNVLFLMNVYAGDSADSIGDEVVFSSTTTAANQVEVTQDSVITGNTAVTYATGQSGVVWGSGSFTGGTGGNPATWTSSQTSTPYSLHRLGVLEILSNTQLPHRIRAGMFYIDTPAKFVWPYNLIVENSDHHVMFKMSYTANDSEVNIERWQINTSVANISFRNDQYNSDNPRDRFAPAGNVLTDTVSEGLNDLRTGNVMHFTPVQLITCSSGNDHIIDSDSTNGYMYMTTWSGANGNNRIFLPKVADNEGRLLRFKSDGTIGANSYYDIYVNLDDYANGTRIDGVASFNMRRPYDGIMCLCYDGDWYVIQRKEK